MSILASDKSWLGSCLSKTDTPPGVLELEEEEHGGEHPAESPPLQRGENRLSVESDDALDEVFEIIESPLSMDKNVTPVRGRWPLSQSQQEPALTSPYRRLLEAMEAALYRHRRLLEGEPIRCHFTVWWRGAPWGGVRLGVQQRQHFHEMLRHYQYPDPPSAPTMPRLRQPCRRPRPHTPPCNHQQPVYVYVPRRAPSLLEWVMQVLSLVLLLYLCLT